MHRIIRMGHSGHTTLEYDPIATTQAGKRQVAVAEKTVNDHIAKGFPAFAVMEDTTEKLDIFDPTQKEILLALPLAGGQ